MKKQTEGGPALPKTAVFPPPLHLAETLKIGASFPYMAVIVPFCPPVCNTGVQGSTRTTF